MNIASFITLGFRCCLENQPRECDFDTNCDFETVNDCTLVSNLEEGIQIITRLQCERDKGLFKRTDSVINHTEHTVLLSRPESTIATVSDNCLHGFKSEWCEEFTPISARSFESHGRSCMGAQPYFSFGKENGTFVVVNILPMGDWRVRLEEVTEQTYRAAVDQGDDSLSIEISPGQEYKIQPEYLVSFADVPYPSGTNVQTYAIDSMRSDALNRLKPVVYNTWFDTFHIISIDEMLRQAESAKEIGCETFVVDAGWFGPGVRHWTYVGDWRENPSVFSEMSLREFTDKIREIGLNFGIWMEPERVHRDAPARLENPQLFLPTDDPNIFYPNLNLPEARELIYNQISTVLSSYDVKWLKVDCNHNFSRDPLNQGHRTRLKHWYSIMDRLIKAFPDTIFEACASGGLRADLNTLSHYHAHFLSDTVDPLDTINLGIPAFSRLNPGMQSKWTVLYPLSGFTPYENEPFDTGDYVLCPTLATSHKLSSYHLSFAVRASMPGVIGFGGNIAGLNQSIKTQLTQHISFYKENRDFIQNSLAISLSSIPYNPHDPVRIIQLVNRNISKSMIFVYNTSLKGTQARIVPKQLTGDAKYSVLNVDSNEVLYLSGTQLMNGELEPFNLGGQESLIININQLDS